MSVSLFKRQTLRNNLVKGNNFNGGVFPPPDFPPGSPFVYTNPDSTSSYPGSGTTVFDLSGNSNNGTLTNGPTFTSGTPAYFNLDGTNDYINYGDIGDTYGSFTALNWAYLDVTTDYRSVMSKWSDTGNQRSWMMVIDGGVQRAYWDRSGTFANQRNISGTSVSANTWYLFGMTYNSSNGNCELWRNNVSLGTATFSGAGDLFNSTSPLQLGLQGEPSRPFDGRMGKFFLYKSVLSSTDLTRIWDVTKTTYGY